MISLVKVQEEDIDTFTKIAIESFVEDKEKYGTYPPFIDSSANKLLFIENTHNFKIMVTDEMVGGIIIFEKNSNHYILGSIFIKPEFQGKGVGQQALILSELEFPEVTTWTLDTPYKSYRNHYLYEKLGYKKIGEEQPDKNNEFKLFIYEKKITN